MLERSSVQDAFPYLRNHAYLNTAAAGLSPVGPGAAAAVFYDSVKSMGMQGAAEWRGRAQAVKAQLAELLGVSPAAVHFVGSTTEGMNLIALSLPLNPADRVVIAADEFPSVAYAWGALRRRGIDVAEVSIPTEAQRTEALCKAIDGSVRALAVSHIHWRTGTRVDLARLSERCRQFDCWLIVDGVQAVGAVPADAPLTDAYCASVFKWLLSGFGLGFIVLSERLAATLSPAIRGYGNEPPSRGLGYGHVNYPGIYSLEASLNYLQSVGWREIYRRVEELSAQTVLLLRRRGLDIITPGDARGGIVSARHPQATRIVAALAAESVLVEDREAMIRISPHFYNDERDLERLDAALRVALR